MQPRGCTWIRASPRRAFRHRVRDFKAGRERLWEFEPIQLEEARGSLQLIEQQWGDVRMKLK
jgi:hypothetical protein